LEFVDSLVFLVSNSNSNSNSNSKFQILNSRFRSVGCYCEQESRCHRSLLRAILADAGARLADART
jgi:hypothetical protein